MVDSEEEDFEVFNRLNPIESLGTTSRPLPFGQINSNQKPTDILEAMVLQHKKNTSLFELLESHAGGSTLEVAIQPRPPTPHHTRTSPSKQLEKKWKREKKYLKRAKLLILKTLSPRRGHKLLKGLTEKTWQRVRVWRWFLDLEPNAQVGWSPTPMDSSIRDFKKGKAGYVADALKQPLLLPQDMADLKTLKKHEAFLTLKRDLAMVWTSTYFLCYIFFFFFTWKTPLSKIK